ncbi:hypothetical protein [Anabaena azotica]|uniref:SxtJ n=1 Tax=Anabaena azotica FACHB-119 TaxID=947527 RepID=A0ABR8D9P4_9NOST|nr:hypothetical protein [Anabaena azotica]MBD2503925.1 hypothetical protein [Anabaena azotica FACHB-119]
MENKTEDKKQRIDDITRMISYSFAGFSLSQLLGFLQTAFNFWQASLIMGLIMMVSLVPGLLEHSTTQSKFNGNLHKPLIISFYIPSLVLIGILFAGFVIGSIVAL